MVLQYFKHILEIFKSSFEIFARNIKTQLIIWLMILIQVICASYSINYFLTAPVGKYSIGVILALVFLVPSFIFMYKMVFNIASSEFDTNELSNFRIIRALLVLGVFNLIPFLVLTIFMKIAELNPQLSQYLMIILNILTYIFYLSMSLSICAIVDFQDRNIAVAILKSIKIFFKKVLYTTPVFVVIFLLGYLAAMALCAIIYAINLQVHILNDKLIDVIYMVIKIYPLYMLAGVYLGAQISVLKEADE